jgi:hypothetical protein
MLRFVEWDVATTWCLVYAGASSLVHANACMNTVSRVSLKFAIALQSYSCCNFREQSRTDVNFGCEFLPRGFQPCRGRFLAIRGRASPL